VTIGKSFWLSASVLSHISTALSVQKLYSFAKEGKECR